MKSSNFQINKVSIIYDKYLNLKPLKIFKFSIQSKRISISLKKFELNKTTIHLS